MMKGDQKRKPPNQHLVAFFTFVALLPLVYYLPPWISEYVSSDPLVVTVVAVAVIVPIISYIALPGMLCLLQIIKR